MTDVEEFIKKVAKETKKSRKEIEEEMNKRKEKTHGLLSDYGAIYAVAKEHGIDLSGKDLAITKIKDLKPASSVNICGKVKVVFSVREFQRKDNSKGKFASVILMDNTGEIRLILWDQNSEIIKQLHVGDILLAKNAYAKDNNGIIEAHAGSLSSLLINPAGLKIDLPKFEEKRFTINELQKDMSSVNLIARVTSYFPRAEFTRSDGSSGSRASFIGEDKSGKIRVVLWDQNSEIKLNDGDFVKIENAYVKEGLNKELELHVGAKGRILITKEKIDLPQLETKVAELKINAITPNISGINTIARVLRVYEPREYVNGIMASLIVGDITGSIRVVLWDKKSELAKELKRSDAIRIKNAYSRPNMNDEPEIHIGKYGDIVVNQDLNVPSLSDIEKSLIREKNIVDLENNERNIKISGKIVGVDETRPLIYMTCPGCNKRVQNLGGEWFCETCGDIDPDPNMIVSMTIEDSTGNIRAVAFKENAEKILGIDIEEAMNLIGELGDEKAPIKQNKEKVINSKVSLVGRVRYNDYSDQLEFIVDEAVV